MRIGVVTFPGSNCEQDVEHVLGHVLGQEVVKLAHPSRELHEVRAIVIPGGFAYGDHLRAGAIAARQPVMEAIRGFAERGGAVVGICNGFQILCEAGLLPGALARNASGRFVCREVTLSVPSRRSCFTSAIETGGPLRLPIAHAEGAYACDAATLEGLEARGQIVARYEGDNPNGSLAYIAGVANTSGNVVGLMPHPERACEASLGSTDGLGFFRSLLTFASGGDDSPRH